MVFGSIFERCCRGEERNQCRLNLTREGRIVCIFLSMMKEVIDQIENVETLPLR